MNFIKKWIENRKESERKRIIELRRLSFELTVRCGKLYITCDGIACHCFDDSDAKHVLDTFRHIQDISSKYDSVNERAEK